jgi:hypothetical protein
MHRSLSLVVATLLLGGCQSPFFANPGADGTRMVARSDQDTLANLHALSTSDAQALASLDVKVNQPATFKLDVADFEAGNEEQLKDVVYADYMTAVSHAQAAGFSNVLPSVNLVDGVAKQVNDSVYARLELIEEQDRKADLRRRLYAAFRKAYDAHPDDAEWKKLLIRAAASLKLAGESPDLPSGLQGDLDAEMADFDAHPDESKPIGFYTLNDALFRIFQADRELHRNVPLEDQGAPVDAGLRQAALAGSVMAQDSDLSQAYDKVSTFYQKMANPLDAFSPTAVAHLKPSSRSWDDLASKADARMDLYQSFKGALEDGMNMNFSLFPSSRAPESTLFSKVQAPDHDLMALLIDAIRSGQVSLKPTDNSGFYQYQEYALEALLKPESTPEGKKITFGDKYLKRLEEAFKTGLTKARETQIKQFPPVAEPTSVEIKVHPQLFVEPLITVYKRYGDMYDFLEREVLPLFSADELKGAKPLTESGDGSDDVPTTIAKAKRLMYGLYLVGADNLGIAELESIPLDDQTRTTAVAEAKDWLSHLPQDQRLAADTRVSIPVSIGKNDAGQKVIRFWGTGGVTFVKVKVEYDKLPNTMYGGATGEPATYFVTADKFLSFERPYDKGVLTRSEYRHILDTSKTWEEAQKRLATE